MQGEGPEDPASPVATPRQAEDGELTEVGSQRSEVGERRAVGSMQ